MIDQKSLKFLKDLSKNNNREWFTANKKRYESDLKKPFEGFIGQLIQALQKFEPDIQAQPKDCIFRIYRDTRFSKDKTPYKNNVGALISKYGRKNKEMPGFYFHLEPGNVMMGGGAYFLDKDKLQRLRQHIMMEPERFNKLLKSKSFRDKFGSIKGEQNKRIPKEFIAFHEKQPLIANKQFYYMAELDPKGILDGNFLKLAASYFKAGKPLNDYFEEALAD